MGSRKKTHEEYVAELAIKNPNVEVVGEYDGAHTKIMHHCLIHDVYWEIKPHNVLHGQGCPKCGKEKYSLSRTKSHEQYVTELAIANPTVVVVDEYSGSKTPILHRCLKHDIEFMMTPSDGLRGSGCHMCRGDKIGDSLRKDHVKYVDEVESCNPNILVIGTYSGANTPIQHKCLIHNVVWSTTPSCILNGAGCPECHKMRVGSALSKTHDEYVNKLKTINPNIEVVGCYVNSNTQILHRCLIHNVEWMASPQSALQEHGCRECQREKLRDAKLKSHEQYVCEVENVNAYIKVVGEYIGANTPILHKCLVCGNEWLAYPNNILRGFGCPSCTKSKGEEDIKQFLDNRNIEYVWQKTFDDCRDVRPLPFDFYLPEYNILIEYDGKQHHEPIEYFGGKEAFEYTKRHDEIKNKYCEDNDIRLLRIPYYEDVDEQLNNFLFA